MEDWVNYFERTHDKRNLFFYSKNYSRFIEIIIENTPQKGRILEIGCGSALISLLLADLGFKVTSLDINKKVIMYAKNKIILNNVTINFVVGNMFVLSKIFKVKSFDTICHSGVLEHFSDEEIILALREQRKIAQKVIFKIPNNRNKLTTTHFGNERFLSNSKWIDLIKEAGFNSINIFGNSNLPKCLYLFIPYVFFYKRFSFWMKWFSKNTIFLCK
ncbi:MAG: class I SAM-dependent methyltransferase [Candidatus Omnitrophica bacterium]|nr:class I SAM-dependent methyltransferase [Candidatus Omnitrophota bacterium]